MLVESIASGMRHQTDKRAEARARQAFAKLTIIIGELHGFGFETTRAEKTAQKALRENDEDTLEQLTIQLGFALKQHKASLREARA
ncbi:hypothetical protein HY992_01455 [Candidatus Micrarchaeota archaeon]|nr:hypothetical protein [Candidatus Micrarchaeota archaeon]